MNTPPKPDPAIYQKMRSNALRVPLPNLSQDQVHVVLMDWHVGTGTATVLAASDGTASIYLSSGGGFIGAGQKSKTVHSLAQQAVQLARTAAPLCDPIESIDLPPQGEVFFYLRTPASLFLGIATDAALGTGKDPFAALGAAMQKIVSAYRVISAQQQSKPKP
jgi:hypothetical protein